MILPILILHFSNYWIFNGFLKQATVKFHADPNNQGHLTTVSSLIHRKHFLSYPEYF